MSKAKAEIILNRVSMVLLVGVGVFFIYEGSTLIELHRESPEKIPAKVAVAGSLTIFLGVASILFAGLHLFFAGAEAMKQTKKNSA